MLGDPEHLVHCGPGGAGQVVKAVNQLAMGLGNAAYLEAVAFGVQAGVDPATIRQTVGGVKGWRAQFTAIADRVVNGTAEGVGTKFAELLYFLREARENGINVPLTEALFAFCDPAPRNWRDNRNRPTVAFWHQLTRKRQ